MEIEDLPKDKKIILFDGVCNLCNSSVQFIIKHDKKDIFRFTSLQSEIGKKIIKYLGVDNKNTDSIILYIPGKAYYIKSDAVINITKELSGIYSSLRMFSIFPKSINDVLYEYIAKKRYDWFGKSDNCIMPTPEHQSKFLT